MTPTDTRPKRVLRHRHGKVLGVVVGLAVTVAVVAEVAPVLAVPPQVPRLRVTNPSVYQTNVEVTDAREGLWLDLGSVARERTKTLEQVMDQGQRWVFRFSYGGIDAGRLVVARSELEGAGWRLRVPEEVGERLRAAGLAPSAL